MATSNYPNNFDPNSFRFGLSRSAGGDIGSASGLSTLPEAFGLVESKGTAWDEFNTEFQKLKAAEQRALDQAVTREEAMQIAYEQAKENNERLKSQADKDSFRSKLGTGLKLAGTIGAGLIMASDERTKNTIETLEDACKILNALKPVSYYYNEEYTANPERMHYGFIAQQYAHVMPDQTYYDESIDKLCIDTSDLIAVLVRGYQQLESRIQRLELSHTILGDK